MLKKTLMTAAALAIAAGVTTLSATGADAGVTIRLGFGYQPYTSYSGERHMYYYEQPCYWKQRKVRVAYWRNGHKYYRWVWRSYKVCY